MKKPVFLIIFFTALVLFIAFDFKTRKTEEDSLPYFARFYDTKISKRQFFDFMRPIIADENDRVLKQRKQLLKLYQKRTSGEGLSAWDKSVFEHFAELYFVNPEEYDADAIWELLKRRIDIVPIELALAQSANESAWGRSRFAMEGNAMFGQWTFSRKKAGMIPRKRVPDSGHAVAKFPSVRAAVKSYIKNLNTHPAYVAFRILRSTAREKGSELDGQTLAPGLINYSERRKAYVQEIQAIMKTNKPLMNLDLQ
jgi:Bax protein